ncbi:MAG: serine--tRNA ligase [Candidatus Omnitrophica bacterium CG1_02_44_16]|nr:MAG: serine--tRNA ligase [Candidatus Omnitrophica bacterium CG1_02_44_16]PIY83979.1 MAG: serine--tRNA ligase [Candidatus Omnitrophica bacterium CG_4_10_14_0_8_um_filter_44_12]PIZ85005.1 MAG: serine--tRNA ligase [Candidatus Omnitrophica bacterium CG_4_10_14_0_2_um_filter_44_9]
MLDIRFIRENIQLVKASLEKRNNKFNLDEVIALDEARRKILLGLDELRRQKNEANDAITAIIKEKKDPKGKIDSMKGVAVKIDELEAKLSVSEEQLSKLLMAIPNIVHESIPVGDPKNNKVVRQWGEVKKLDFQARPHTQICEYLDIVDFVRGAKLTGSNFILYKKAGARLERALINFMVDLHTSKHGYQEMWPPALVNRASMTGTGQLPKLEDDVYRLKDEDLFLIPTAEVPVTNIHRDEILDEEALPLCYTAYTPCFRREAGSYGKDTKGLVRIHQFDKVEMVKFVKPQDSFNELEKLVADAESVLQALGLTYRVVMLASGDISFAAAKCYDLEAYAPGLDAWLEVSSCSNFLDFQARRANIRYRGKETKKVDFVHTLNGSGVALARTFIAILENYQQKDGSVVIPGVLRPYMGGMEKIER